MPAHKKHSITCPKCGTSLKRTMHVIINHYRVCHEDKLSEAEAFRIASPQRKGTPYAEELKRNFLEVQGGAPSLGKKR